MANQPDFNRMKIRGGESPYREPVMPGEQRLIPSMQEKLQPALPPVRKAAEDLLEETVAQIAPRMLRGGNPSERAPYLRTPEVRQGDAMIMQNVGDMFTGDDLRNLLDEAYPGYRGV